MYYEIEWETLDGAWVSEEIVAADFGDACDEAERIANTFGTGIYRCEVFGRETSREGRSI